MNMRGCQRVARQRQGQVGRIDEVATAVPYERAYLRTNGSLSKLA
jgi:hypothetical protein